MYIDLINNPARQYNDVSYNYCEQIGAIVLIAHKKVISNDSEVIKTEFIVPYVASNDVDIQRIEKIQKFLCKNDPNPSIILAMVDTSSMILYYRLTNCLLDLNAAKDS